MEQKLMYAGSFGALVLGYIGHWTANEWVIGLGIISAILTIMFTLYKFTKEIIKDFRK
jgi:1,4-dihydroxy-2-naphthoate octaprenyltransferase